MRGEPHRAGPERRPVRVDARAQVPALDQNIGQAARDLAVEVIEQDRLRGVRLPREGIFETHDLLELDFGADDVPIGLFRQAVHRRECAPRVEPFAARDGFLGQGAEVFVREFFDHVRLHRPVDDEGRVVFRVPALVERFRRLHRVAGDVLAAADHRLAVGMVRQQARVDLVVESHAEAVAAAEVEFLKDDVALAGRGLGRRVDGLQAV